MSSVAKVPAEGRRGFSLLETSSARLVLAALVAITVFSVFYQQRWGTITDTSWLITVCERLLAGEKLYVDIFETNPPFSVWLYIPPVALAKFLGIAPETLVHAWTYLAAIVGLGFAGVIVRRAQFPETAALLVLAPLFYALLVIVPGNAFSQREHIGMALFLPLLALMAWRAQGQDAATTPSAGIASLAGLSGSVIVLVKPHYALMVLVPALFTAFRQRSLRPLFAPEHWVIGAVCVAYLALVLVFHREFVSDVYPLLAETYMKTRLYEPIFQLYAPGAVLLGLALWLNWPPGRAPELARTAALASAVGVATLLWQAKGWPYHAYPALLCASIAIVCLMCRCAKSGSAVERTGWRGGLFLAARIFVFMAGLAAASIPFLLSQKPSDEIVAAMRAEVTSPTVASIAIDIATAHPLSRMIDGNYRSRYPSLWIVRSTHSLTEAAGDDSLEAERLEALRDGYIAQAAEDIERSRPDIILDGGRQTAGRRIIHADPAIARILGNYRTLYQDDTVTVLVRSDLHQAAAAAGPPTPPP